METTMAILQDMTNAELIALVKALQTKGNGRPNIKLNALGTVKVNPKTGERTDCKGNVSVYGLGRFPVTLYASQWKRLLAMAEDILEVIENAPEGALATKED